MTAAGTVDGRQLDWLLVDFVRGTAGARHALVVSADGLRLAASQGIDEALGDQLAAVTSGLLSLAQGVAASFQAGPGAAGRRAGVRTCPTRVASRVIS